ncbi:hypothetical protein ACFL2P_00580 [Candidatus Moduliflexota bacterium]
MSLSNRTRRGLIYIVSIVTSLLFAASPSCDRNVSSGEPLPAKKITSGHVGADPQQWAEKEAREAVSRIRKGHPKLFLTPERITEIRQQAVTSKKYFFDLLVKKMHGVQAALFYALGEGKSLGLPKTREEYGRIAAEALMTDIARNDKKVKIDDLALIYDWAHDALTPGEKQAFVTFCKSRVGSKLPVHLGKQHGYRAPPTPQGWLPLIAIYGDGIEDEYARRLLTEGIRDTLFDNLAMEQVAGGDGGYADGTGYYLLVGGTFYPFLALGIASDTDFFFQHEVTAKIPNFLIHTMLPMKIRRVGWDESSIYFAMFHDNWTSTPREYGSPGNSFRMKLAVTAAEYKRRGDEKRAGLYFWLLEQMGGIHYITDQTVQFILNDWSIKPLSPSEAGFSTVGTLGWDEEKGRIDRDRFGKKSGIGWISMRSAWDDPDATFAILRAEPFRYHGHQHRDSLGFMIAKGEELAIAHAGNYMVWYEGGPLDSDNPGWAQMGNFFSRTISSSNLLVYNPAEDFDGFSNDGGQRFVSYWDDKWGRTYNGTKDGNDRDLGGLTGFDQGEDFVYVSADATRAYNSSIVTSGGNPPKVKQVKREFVYLRSPGGNEESFVIYDRVDAVKPEFRKIWLLQLRAKPELDGEHEVVVGDEKGGIHISEDTSSFRIVQERAELSGDILLPKEGNRVFRRLGGWVETRLKESMKADENGPVDIEVESTEGLPDHPVVIITDQEPDPGREIYDKYNQWPKIVHADSTPVGRRTAFFCEGKTDPDRGAAKLLDCVRATRSAPGFDMPAGSRVIQEFRHMGVEGADRDRLSERINYPWGFGLGYNYGDGNLYGLWRIEVSPKKASGADRFLHVLHPSLKGGGGAKSELVESVDGTVQGALVGSKAVLFSRETAPLREGSYKLPERGRMWQLLCNLAPGRKYEIRQDGEIIVTGEASGQGVLHFEAAAKSGGSEFHFAVAD